MMISIEPTDQSDATFTSIVSAVCSAEAWLLKAEAVFVVEIDHAFDKKWREFSGVIAPQVGTWFGPYSRVPPFHPNRVVRQTAFRRSLNVTTGYERVVEREVHVRQSSHRNLYRQLRRIATPAIFTWYGGGTGTTDQGTLLVYRITESAESSWFATLAKNQWRLARGQGISRREFEQLVNTEFASAGTEQALAPDRAHE